MSVMKWVCFVFAAAPWEPDIQPAPSDPVLEELQCGGAHVLRPHSGETVHGETAGRTVSVSLASNTAAPCQFTNNT